MQGGTVPSPPGFAEARRDLDGLLRPLERRALNWLAPRVPPRIGPDHLTLIGLLAMAGAGSAYALSRRAPEWLHVVNLALAVNWVGDSLDGTLARHRAQSRPRYGFYVDHMVDTFGVLFLLGGLALSGYMSPPIAVGLLVAYYMMAINSYLATYTVGVFKLSYGPFGPTEGRVALALGNLVLLATPTVTLAGRTVLAADLVGALGIAAMMIMLVRSVSQVTAMLYRAERIARPDDAPSGLA